MKMTNTTFKNRHELPMDKITYDNIQYSRYSKHITESDWPAESRFVTLPCHISYNEDLQIASFESYRFLFSIEQTPDYFIITMHRFDIYPEYYFINKKTGEITMLTHNRRFYFEPIDGMTKDDLIDGLLRVYGKTEDELMETDFIPDKLKTHIRIRILEREYEDP